MLRRWDRGDGATIRAASRLSSGRKASTKCFSGPLWLTRLSANIQQKMQSKSEGNPDFVLSLARGLEVITAFQGEREGLTVSEISDRTKLSRAAVRRLLITLELLGYAERRGS